MAAQPDKLAILGAESLGREALEIARAQGLYQSVIFLDDRPQLRGAAVDGAPVAGGFADHGACLGDHAFFVAVGNRRTRLAWLERLSGLGGTLATLAHPRACLASKAAVGPGSMINAGCHIGPNASLGRGCILWSNVVVSHDCRLGEGCFISPGVMMGGYADIGEGCMIGLGASVRSDVRLGRLCVLAMGAVARDDLAELTYLATSGKQYSLEEAEQESRFFKPHSERALSRDRRRSRED